MSKNKLISTNQIRAFIVTMVIGVGILTLPRDLSRLLQNDGWIGVILGVIPALLMTIVINKIFCLFPDKNIYQIGKEIY